MVVGWQYIPFPHLKVATIGPYPNGLRLESMPMPQWYYFGQDGVLQEFVGKQVLEAKQLLQIPTNIMGEQYDSSAEKRVYYFEDQRSYHTLKLVGFLTKDIGIIYRRIVALMLVIDSLTVGS